MAEHACPYCESKFEDKEMLSSHIDNIHIGPGLLEGDKRKFWKQKSMLIHEFIVNISLVFNWMKS